MPVSKLNKQELSKEIKNIILDEGFDLCGISKCTNLDFHKKKIIKWLDNEYNASMNYLEKNIDKREKPELLLENCKSVISLAINYYNDVVFDPENQYSISKYALGKDYHLIIKEKLHSILKKIENISGVRTHRSFVDTAPVFERAFAVNAGLGWIGKNSCLIIPKKGSFFFLAEIFTTLELDYDKAFNNDYCGSCEKCIQACPNQAIIKPRIIDSRKCISYLTIESKNDIPKIFRNNLSGQIYGCDICQDVCPFNNKYAVSSGKDIFKPSDEILKLKKSDWNNMTEEQFNLIFSKINSPVSRTGYNKMMMNVKCYTHKNQ